MPPIKQRRKATDPNYKVEIQQIQEQLTEQDLDFVNMPKDSKAYMAYYMSLRGWSLSKIAEKLHVQTDTARTMINGVTERMIGEAAELGRQLYAKTMLRLEAVILATGDAFFADDDGAYSAFDPHKTAAFMQAIKLQIQVHKMIFGDNTSTIPNSQHQHLHLHVPTMERKSPLYEMGTQMMNPEEIQHHYPELIERNQRVQSSDRFSKLDSLIEDPEQDNDGE